jgi:hypothetical protein
MEFVILARLPSLNVLYGGVHHTKRTAIKNEWHRLVRAALPADARMFDVRVDITIHAYYIHPSCDSDNVMAKLIIDGMKGVVIADDNNKYVRDVTLRATVFHEDAVWVEVKEADETTV